MYGAVYIYSRSSSTELNVRSCLYIQPFKQCGVKCTELFIYTAVQAVTQKANVPNWEVFFTAIRHWYNPHENGFTFLRTNSYSSVIYFVKGTLNTHSLFEIVKVNRITYSISGVEEYIWG